MKKIEAIVKPHVFEIVKDALVELGIDGMTVSEVSDSGPSPAGTLVFRGARQRSSLNPRLKLEIVVYSDRLAGIVIRTIEETARTGRDNDGMIYVSEVLEAIRIRTGDWGEAAL
ncbi:MAG TPA: P-II family nitrogen regulator [Polyangiaceae bacterium]|nr:P-II family nitrogen regulator [Polyangiaceae bacterium]